MDRIQKNIEYWVITAEHDLKTAKSMFDSGHYDWSLYIGHLILEKILKANYVKALKEIPTKTHDLLYLVNNIELEIEDEKYQVLEKANNYQLEARYPDEKLNFYNLCTKEFTEPRFKEMIEVYEWLKSLLI
jgi:HEPN domain-containing protein